MASLAGAEWFVGGQVGVTVPNDFRNIQGTGVSTGVTQTDLSLKRSALLGVRVGYFFNEVRWLGIEIEAYHSNPHVKQQFTTISSGGIPISSGLAQGNHFQVVTWALNLLVRYPGKTIQPYAGIGAGAFYGRLSGIPGANQSSTDLAPGLNALGGARWFVSKNIAWFIEYKYNRTTFEFSEIRIKGLYSAHHASLGLAYHF